jgi:hypothetical protein
MGRLQQPAEEDDRQPKFRRNDDLERLLAEINSYLAPVEQRLAENFHQPRYPVLFLAGCPRSGTTLFMQWLANLGCFAYPTNFLSRFYAAPYLGAKLQQLILDERYNFNNELFDFSTRIDYLSENGKTIGALAPNEYWYFWRRFFPYKEIHYLAESELMRVAIDQFAAELAALEAVFDKPLAMKAMIANLNLPFLASHVPQAVFVVMQRDPLFNIQSLLEARVRQLGSREPWYSFKPPEYPQLKSLSPIEQVAGQVYYLQLGIDTGLAQIDPNRFLRLEYLDFCLAPEAAYHQLCELFTLSGYELDSRYPGPSHFTHTDQIRLSEAEVDQIRQAYQRFSQQKDAPS